MTGAGAPAVQVHPVVGLPEVAAGDDLAALVAAATHLQDGDVVVVTSKVVSKAEGRVRVGDREGAVAEATDRVVARRGPTTIVRTPLGLVMAAGGVDASNVAAGQVVLLPVDPDASAARLRSSLQRSTGSNVAVVVTDTSGRAWRTGQTDIAIGAAGLRTLVDLSGTTDGYGNTLVVTAPAVADEIAGAGDLVKGKLSGVPVAVVRGLDAWVLPPGEDGPGAGVLVRPEAEDLFGYGAREAVLRAVLADDDGRGFGAVAPADELSAAVAQIPGVAGCDPSYDVPAVRVTIGDRAGDGRTRALVEVVARAHGWVATPEGTDPDTSVLRPRTP